VIKTDDEKSENILKTEQTKLSLELKYEVHMQTGQLRVVENGSLKERHLVLLTVSPLSAFVNFYFGDGSYCGLIVKIAAACLIFFAKLNQIRVELFLKQVIEEI